MLYTNLVATYPFKGIYSFLRFPGFNRICNTPTPLSVRPSVCLSLTLCSCHRIIMKFSGVITIDKSNVHA